MLAAPSGICGIYTSLDQRCQMKQQGWVIPSSGAVSVLGKNRQGELESRIITLQGTTATELEETETKVVAILRLGVSDLKQLFTLLPSSCFSSSAVGHLA